MKRGIIKTSLIGIIALLCFNTVVADPWTAVLHCENVFGTHCHHYAENTIQSYGGETNGLYTPMKNDLYNWVNVGSSPFFSTYDDWGITPKLLIKLDEEKAVEIARKIHPLIEEVDPGCSELFLSIQSSISIDPTSKPGHSHIMLQPHTWLHSRVPLCGSVGTNVKTLLFKPEKIDKTLILFKRVRLDNANKACISHDCRLSGVSGLKVEELNEKNSNNSRIYLSVVNVVSDSKIATAEPVAAQPVGKTVITLHLLLNHRDMNQLSDILDARRYYLTLLSIIEDNLFCFTESSETLQFGEIIKAIRNGEPEMFFE